LKINEPGPWPHIDLGRRGNVKAGQLCLAIGYARLPNADFGDRLPSVCLGAVTRAAVPLWLTSSHRFFAGAYCVFDVDGRLLGLTHATGIDEAVHASAESIKTYWEDLVAGKNLDRLRLHPHESEPGRPAKPSAAASEGSAATAIKKGTAASVRINLVGQKGNFSGVIVTSDGYVITCAHHQRPPGQMVEVRLSDGRDARAVVLGSNAIADVGLLKITDKGQWPHVELGSSAAMKPGDRCVLVGYPVARPGRQPWVRETRIIQPTHTLPRRDEWYCEFWTSGYPNSLGGVSGGGVFDLQGHVMGVILGGASDEMQHSRVELFRKQWDALAAGKPIDVLNSKPLAEVTAAFSRIAKALPPIAVKVFIDGKQRALGTIVGSNGRILTKASELYGAISCRLADGRIFPATVEKVSREHDLAVLKVDAADLPEPRWSESSSVATGTLIAALVPRRPPLPGVVSLAARPIPPVTGGLGVLVRDGKGGLEVYDDSTAKRYDAPLRKGDIVVDIEGRRTPDLKTFRELIGLRTGVPIGYAGDPVRVGVLRGGKTMQFRFPLPPSDLTIQYNGAKYESRRWSAFPSVFDTDLPLTPELCGGPVIDRNGCVVGISIACRTTYGGFGQRHVIPASVVKGVVADCLDTSRPSDCASSLPPSP